MPGMHTSAVNKTAILVSYFIAHSRNGVMGLNCSRVARQRPNGVFPDDNHKGAQDPTSFSQGKGEVAGGLETVPAPPVVISWVLRDVAEWRPTWLLASIDKKMRRELHIEAHASRLFKCWTKHGDEFPKAFAAELSVLLETIPEEDFWGPIHERCLNKHGLLALFFAQISGASRSSSVHVRIGSKELWPSVLAEIRRKNERAFRSAEWAERAEWAEPADFTGMCGRDKMLEMLGCLEAYIPGEKEPHATGNSKRMMKAVKKLEFELTLAHNIAVEVHEKVRSEAKRERQKASLRRAPWERPECDAPI